MKAKPRERVVRNDVSSKAVLSLLVVLAAMNFPGKSSGVEPEKKFMGDMVSESDVIMVGEVTGLFPIHEYGQMYAHVRNVSPVKGSGDLDFIYRTGISEDNPRCCEIGKRYLFFARRQTNGFYVPVGGGQGVVPVE